MSIKDKNIWIGKDDLQNDKSFYKEANKEFFKDPFANQIADKENLSSKSSRRDFLKFLGFGLGAATIAAGCDTPIRRAIPYVNKPDAIVPGQPTYYASNYVKGGDYCPILVKTREGRPIKIEGNKMSSMTNGGTSARVQASVLELYDTARYKNPSKVTADGLEELTWDKMNQTVLSGLQSAQNIRLVSGTIMSPLTLSLIEKFTQKYPGTKHVMYDANSSAALLDAHEMSYGKRIVPGYKFDKADVIVSLDADFLGTWISPVEYSSAYAKGRKVKNAKNADISRLYVVESAMSLTGSNADNRVITNASESGMATALLYNEVAKSLGGGTAAVGGQFNDEKTSAKIKAIAADLINQKAKGKSSLIVNGSNNLGEQLLTIALNQLLGNIGNTVDLANYSQARKGSDKDINQLAQELKNGQVDAIIFMDDVNPVYDLPFGSTMAEHIKNVKTSVAIQLLPTETAAVCGYIAPVNHLLETWGDVQAKKNNYGLIQPTIEPLYNTKSANELLAVWAGISTAGEDRADYNLLRSFWKSSVMPLAGTSGWTKFWETTLHDGIVDLKSVDTGIESATIDLSLASSKLGKPSGSADVKLYENVNVGTGSYANNPWLQEMPDPIYRTVWNNFVTIPLSWDGKRTISGMNDWSAGDIVSVTINGKALETPVVDQFGVKEGAHGLALGYGRTIAGRAARGVGINAAQFIQQDADGYFVYHAPITFGAKVGKDDEFACVQYHHSFGVKDKDPNTGEVLNVDEQSIATIATGYQGALTDRSVLYYSDKSTIVEDLEELHSRRAHAKKLNSQQMYKGHDDLYNRGHKWALSVDLNGCTGCGACQVACVAENNVPVVGKKEVSRHHEMTWLRIDRYFFGDIESPNTAYQPMMCQHCDNAGCENVCPVGATNHSSEGLNHMTYNRCIGTRYCANNCAYKVRRFNWLDYTTADLFGANESDPFAEESDVPFYAENMTRMVLNPDVTVRSRGVIEKCSMCVQKIQTGKLTAKIEKRALKDGDITTACASACPSGSIVFGDVNDSNSAVSKLNEHELNYYVLEEVNTRSSVGYHMKVTNKNKTISDLDA